MKKIMLAMLLSAPLSAYSMSWADAPAKEKKNQ